VILNDFAGFVLMVNAFLKKIEREVERRFIIRKAGPDYGFAGVRGITAGKRIRVQRLHCALPGIPALAHRRVIRMLVNNIQLVIEGLKIHTLSIPANQVMNGGRQASLSVFRVSEYPNVNGSTPAITNPAANPALHDGCRGRTVGRDFRWRPI